MGGEHRGEHWGALPFHTIPGMAPPPLVAPPQHPGDPSAPHRAEVTALLTVFCSQYELRAAVAQSPLVPGCAWGGQEKPSTSWGAKPKCLSGVCGCAGGEGRGEATPRVI